MGKIKPIPGYEKLYGITKKGRVFSYRTKKVLVEQNHRLGYKYIYLSSSGKRKKYYIHRLVLLTFRGNSELDVNHKNGIKSDNSLNNLEYVTKSQNFNHAIKLGLVKHAKGNNSGASKLTEFQIKYIKNCLFPIFNNVDIANLYEVHQSTIARIRTGKSWGHV